MSETKVIHEHRNIENEPKVKVEISKGQRGGYGWTIALEGVDAKQVLAKIKEVDAQLRDEYMTSEIIGDKL